jgi:hypothetical protein
MGGLGLQNPTHEAEREYASSKRVTAPLVDQIVAQSHQLPDESHIKSAQQAVRKEREIKNVRTGQNVLERVPHREFSVY